MDTLRIYTDFDLLIRIRDARRRKGMPVYPYEKEVHTALLSKKVKDQNSKEYKIKSLKKCWKFGYYFKLIIEDNKGKVFDFIYHNESSIDEGIISKKDFDNKKFLITD